MGVIHAFMTSPNTKEQAIDLAHGGKLIFFTEDVSSAPTIANDVDALLHWLGVPKGFTVYLWWRDDPRHIKAHEWPSKTTVNGGWAVPGIPEVFIYRSEEYDRVLIHEVIHAMKWDWTMPSTPLPCWGLGPNAQVSPHLCEAWTELYAEWLWCGWHNVPWKTQRIWQDHQAVQILARQGTRSWSENTNVFAYYILKAALAPHMEFLWLFGNGMTHTERTNVLCKLTSPELARLRAKVQHTPAKAISMRMSVETKK